ncbi:MAG: ABC transporter ATP-binding protein [Lachnospiraceae bacterium]|nr:ABC transporter ATP-binding protein [Lachnospiraceae bacterium]
MIEVNRVSVAYTALRGIRVVRNKALDEVSFTVPEGSVYGLLGTNGAGKSTLMRAMSGIFRPDSGSVIVDGRDVWNSAEAKADICYVGDELSWYERFTVGELQTYGRNCRASFSGEAFDRMVKALELPKDRKLSRLSKGMRRQAITIFGVACRTKYLLLDESFDGLDPAMRRIVREMLTDEVCDNGSSIVLSSHNVTEISEACDHILLLHGGKIVESGEIDDICDRYRKIQLVGSEGNVFREMLEKAGIAVLNFTGEGSVAQAVVRGTDEEVRAGVSKLHVNPVETVPLTLEEVFIYAMREKGYGKINAEK